MAVSLNTALGAFPITALAGTAYVPLAGGTMTGALTIASGTLTASAPALNITQTWNQGATVFTALKLNVTNTASDDNSMLCDLQLAGTSKFNVSRNGVVTTTNTILLQNILSSGSLYIPSDAAIRWSSTTSVNVANDVLLYRDAAATLALRNGTTAQRMHIYGTADEGLTNYERLTLSTTAGTSVNITAETLGTGGDNLDIVLTPAGTGAVRYGTHSALAAETVTGYITIKDAGGTTRKLAVVS